MLCHLQVLQEAVSGHQLGAAGKKNSHDYQTTDLFKMGKNKINKLLQHPEFPLLLQQE